jgi:uncharacterized protein YodC (DUF2158 family)
MNSFQVGDVVIERGNTIRMTIARISGSEVVCQWFVDAALQKKAFRVDGLIKTGD